MIVERTDGAGSSGAAFGLTDGVRQVNRGNLHKGVLPCKMKGMNIRSEIRQMLAAAIKTAAEAGDIESAKDASVLVQYPPKLKETGGDYATPAALSIAKKEGKNPMAVAAAILSRLEKRDFLEKAEPGFINFHVRPTWMAAKMDDIIREAGSFGAGSGGAGKTVNLEFVSANPTGLPTFGNGRAMFWADTLGNVLAASGYAVTREYYVNNVGNQVTIYGESVLRRILERNNIPVEFPDGLYMGEEVKDIAAAVEEKFREDEGRTFTEDDLKDAATIEKVAQAAVKETVDRTRRAIEEDCKVKFDVWTFESVLHESGEVSDVMEKLKKSGKAYEKEGAWWFKSTEHGDDKDRVLVRADGRPTYFLGDIAYHRNKLNRGFGVVADFWGADHHGDVARVRGALTAIGEDADRVRFVLAQMVALKEGGESVKISKRAGTSVPLHGFVREVGVSAARFFLTASGLTTHMEFDVALAREQSERNPVYYVQYAYVRLFSLLRKARQQNIIGEDAMKDPAADVSFTEEAEISLAREIMRLPEAVEDVAESWEVHRLTRYASDLARAVHHFYDAVPVASEKDEKKRASRVMLVLAAQTALGRTMDLLGVEKLNVM